MVLVTSKFGISPNLFHPESSGAPRVACSKGIALSPVEASVDGSALIHPLSPALHERSLQALATLATTAMPTDAEEIWRYSRVGQISFADYPNASPTAIPDAVPNPTADPAGNTAGPDDCTSVRFAEQKGLKIHRGAQVENSLIGSLLPESTDAFTLASIAHLHDVTSIDVATGVVVAEPIRIDRFLSSAGVIVGTRLVISVGAQAECTVIERLSSDDVASLVLPMTEIRLAQGARLRYITVQELGASMIQVAMTVSETAADATLSTMAVALGGSYARLRNDARIVGKGAHNELLAVYFGEGDQMHDFRTTQDHVAPKSTSELVFKGAVKDSSRSVYSGLIRIGVNARGTVANQTNRNLLLSPNAAAESVPNLEIENNDVKCSHASAVGPIDDDHRYYLESRGVPSEVAERLIVLGFFAELLERIPDAELRAELSASVTAKFDRRGSVLLGATS